MIIVATALPAKSASNVLAFVHGNDFFPSCQNRDRTACHMSEELEALELTFSQRIIVVRNMEFGRKVYALRTVIDSTVWDKIATDASLKAALRLGRVAEDRNIVAHSPFAPDKSGFGVEFMVAKANGRLVLPDVIWYVEDFQQRFDAMDEIEKALSTLTPHFDRAKIVEHL